MMRVLLGLSLALTGTLFAAAAIAQADPAADYPNRPVRVIVAVAAGGGIDTATRVLTEHVRQRLGHPFVVENRGGAAGNVGADIVFHSKPDGYTLLGSSLSPITINHLLYKNVNFDPAAFEPVALMSRIPNVLVVRQDFPARTAKELLDYLKANPGKVSYASPGAGTAAFLTTELFMQITGTKMLHVPYKGTAPSLNDLLAGHVDVTIAQVGAVHPLHKAGKMRILATATDRRLEFMNDVPTFSEVGVPGAESETWNAISAPPKTSAAIIAKLNSAFNDALSAPEVKARYRDMYFQAGGGNPAEVRKFVTEDAVRWAKVIRATGLLPE